MKKARLVQIIQEEISKVLKEGSMQARELADRNSLQQLQAMYDQLMRDMEQEAEPEGGPIADQYADQMQDIEDAMQIKRGGSGEMTYGDMLHKNYPDKYGPGGVELNEMAVNEMANFYSLDSKIQNSINPEDFKPKGQRNAATTLKKMETGNVTKGDIEKAFKGKDYKKGDIVFTKKDLQPVIDKYGIKLLGKTKDVTPKKEKKSNKKKDSDSKNKDNDLGYSTTDSTITTTKDTSKSKIKKAKDEIKAKAKRDTIPKIKKGTKGDKDALDLLDAHKAEMQKVAKEFKSAKEDGDTSKVNSLTQKLKKMTAKRKELQAAYEKSASEEGLGQELSDKD